MKIKRQERGRGRKGIKRKEKTKKRKQDRQRKEGLTYRKEVKLIGRKREKIR